MILIRDNKSANSNMFLFGATKCVHQILQSFVKFYDKTELSQQYFKGL